MATLREVSESVPSAVEDEIVRAIDRAPDLMNGVVELTDHEPAPAAVHPVRPFSNPGFCAKSGNATIMQQKRPAMVRMGVPFVDGKQ